MNIDHQPHGCFSGFAGNSTPFAESSSYVFSMSSAYRKKFDVGSPTPRMGMTPADGLAEELPGEDSRRRYYRITPAGRAAAARETALLARLVAAAGDAGLTARPESA